MIAGLEHFISKRMGGSRMCARRAVAQELNRTRILEEAKELFTLRGYNQLTMRHIANSLGYSHGALYYHFKDKAELFYSMVAEDFDKLLGLQKEFIQHDQPRMEGLKRIMLEFIRFGMENPHHYEIMFMVRDPELLRYTRPMQNQCLELFYAMVVRVVGKSAGNGFDHYMMAHSLFMSLHGFVSFCIHTYRTFAEVEQLAKAHVDFLCEGLAQTA